MVKLEFTNAKVSDTGFGLYVNDRALDGIISTALGTRLDNLYGSANGLKDFQSNCCNVTVIIDPQPVTTYIADGNFEYEDVYDLEETRREQFTEKNAKTDPEE